MDKDFQNTNAGSAVKNDAEKPKVISAEISIEVIGDDVRPGKISAKRRDFLKKREKRIARNLAIFFALATIGTTFISNIYVALILFTPCLFLTLFAWGSYMSIDDPSESWITPWWYGGL